MPDKNKIILGTNDDTYIAADDAGNIVLQHEGGNRVSVTNTSITPASDEQIDLGSPTNKFKDLYLSSDSIYIGDTKISSDPSTGSLTTAVADGQGGFAPAAPVGGSSSTFDWKGTSVNNVVTTRQNPVGDSVGTNFSMARFWENHANGGYLSTATGNTYLYPFDFPGNPQSQADDGSKNISAGAPFDPRAIFFQDENGDSFPQWLSSKMDEENTDIYQFDIKFIYSLKVSDINKADKIQFLTGDIGNGLTGTNWGNAQTLTKRAMMVVNYKDMYAIKTTMGYHSNGQGNAASGISFYPERTSSDPMPRGNINDPLEIKMVNNFSICSPLNNLFDTTHNRTEIDIEFPDYSAGIYMINEIGPNDSNFNVVNSYTYFDAQDGIEVDMLVKLQA